MEVEDGLEKFRRFLMEGHVVGVKDVVFEYESKLFVILDLVFFFFK